MLRVIEFHLIIQPWPRFLQFYQVSVQIKVADLWLVPLWVCFPAFGAGHVISLLLAALIRYHMGWNQGIHHQYPLI